MIFHTPPANQGQIVEVSYAYILDGVVRRTHDRSTQRESYLFAWWTPQLRAWTGPWNTAPPPTRWYALPDLLDLLEGDEK
jgi:hypothetical protein